MAVRGIRGATTINQDQPENIYQATEELVKAMTIANRLSTENIISVIITTTADIHAAFPAKAVRSIYGWKYVPVIGMQEADVKGSIPLCIRILMHVNTEKTQREIQHVYQNDAKKLRPDLSE